MRNYQSMWKSSVVTFLGSAILLAYQNCSRVDFQPQLSAESLKLDNNGGFYDGKLSGSFYRYVPDFTCENKELPAAAIEINSAGTQLTENKKLLCGAIKQNLDPSLIDSSIYQKEVIGYQEGIFEGESTVPTRIPANLVEVWCKDRNDEQGIETLTHFDRNRNEAVTRIYHSVLTASDASNTYNPRKIPDFPVVRVIANKTVIVKDDKGFELTVHRDQPAPQLGLFKAEMEAVIDGQKISRETFCRLGGSLDPKVWPARQIVDFNIEDFQLSSDENQLTFSTELEKGTKVLLAQALNGTGSSQLTPKGSQLTVSGVYSIAPSFLLSADSRYVVFSVLSATGYMELMVYDRIQGTSRRLSDQFVGQLQLGTAKFSADEASIIFLEYCGKIPQTCLTSVPLTGGAAIRLDPPKANPKANDGVAAFEISKTQNKVIFWCCDLSFMSKSFSNLDLYSVNIDGTQLMKITPKFPSPEWRFICCDNYISYHSFESNTKDYFRISAYLGEHRDQIRSYSIAVDGSGSVELPQDYQNILISSFTGQYVVLNNPSQPNVLMKMMNLKSGQLFDLPPMKATGMNGNSGAFEGFNQTQVDDAFFFSQDSSQLIGSRLLANGNLQAVSISTDTGIVESMCPEISSSELSIKEVALDQYLILSYNQDTQKLSIHKKTKTSKCTKLNSTLATNLRIKTINQVSLSPDQEKLLVRLSAPIKDGLSIPQNDDFHQIFYIPLNGQPALLVNTPVFSAARSYRATFLKDSRSVLYFGDQIRPNEMNLFLWMAP